MKNRENTGAAPLQGWQYNLLKVTAILCIASLLCEGLYRLGVGEESISIVMVLAIFIISAFTDGYGYGLAATLAGVLLYDYLVTEPRLGFSFTLGFPITFSIMLMVTLATSAITGRIKDRMNAAETKEHRVELMYDINRKLLSTREEASIAHYALEYLRDELWRTVVLFAETDGESRPYILEVAGDVAGDCFLSGQEKHAAMRAAKSGKATGMGTKTCPEALGYYIPIVSQGWVLGVFGISCHKGSVPAQHLPFIDLVAGQAAHALRVQVLAKKRQEALVMAETEKARNCFLRGISHDLRTPLTNIIGASATFLDNRRQLPIDTQVQLVAGIQEDAQWLLSMVENVLAITRIQQDMHIEKAEEAAEEIVAEAVALFRKRHPVSDVSVLPVKDLLLVPMDALLITQVINNLLENARRHAGGDRTKVTIGIAEQAGFAEFCVADTGKGIAAAVLPNLFEAQTKGLGRGEDSSRGLGIGLSLCKTIVEMHGGWIKGENLPEGAKFTFALPLGKEVGDAE